MRCPVCQRKNISMEYRLGDERFVYHAKEAGTRKLCPASLLTKAEAKQLRLDNVALPATGPKDIPFGR